MSGIKHIEFWVSDLKGSISFYKKLLEMIGWKQYNQNGFRCGMTKIYFVKKNLSLKENIGPRHICFEADSKETVEKVHDFLKRNDTFIIRGPMEYEYKGNIAYTVDFKDPDGYVVEVATRSHANK